MVLEEKNGMMALIMKVVLKQDASMDKAFINGLMIVVMMEFGFIIT